jgi:hypothetical protein
LFNIDETGLSRIKSPGKIVAEMEVKKEQGSSKNNQCKTWRQHDSW